MATIVHIDTSTPVTSIAVSRDGLVIFEKQNEGKDGMSQASELVGTYCDEAMQLIEQDKLKVDAVCVSSGPGSYTGLRIGTSLAKGMAYGLDAHLIAIPTLEVLCVPVLLEHEIEDNALLCPMIDARRMEVFAAVYDRRLNSVRQTKADIVDNETYREYLNEHTVYFFGNGAVKCKDGIKQPNAHFIENIVPLAKNMMPLAEKRMRVRNYVDVAYFEPDYGKEYKAKLPTNKLTR